jgi:hypothetical protein
VGVRITIADASDDVMVGINGARLLMSSRVIDVPREWDCR